MQKNIIICSRCGKVVCGLTNGIVITTKLKTTVFKTKDYQMMCHDCIEKEANQMSQRKSSLQNS